MLYDFPEIKKQNKIIMATEGDSILNIRYPEDDLNTSVLFGKKLK